VDGVGSQKAHGYGKSPGLRVHGPEASGARLLPCIKWEELEQSSRVPYRSKFICVYNIKPISNLRCNFLSFPLKDAVVRNVYYKYFHPKEALVSNGVLNREISRAAGKAVPGIIDEESSGNNAQALTFVYPFGATLSVMKPAVAVLSTGSVCFPLNRPILAFYHSKNQGGKLAVLGSCHMFSDQYLDKEENSKIMDVVFQWLTTGDIHLNQIDAEDPEGP